MKPDERFAQILCGITVKEVAGLLSSIMRRENLTMTSIHGHKRVRQWKATLIGIEITVREINTHYVPLNSIPIQFRPIGPSSYFNNIEYIIENDEWDFSVLMRSSGKIRSDFNSFLIKNEDDEEFKFHLDDIPPGGDAKLGDHLMYFSYPEFDGDKDTYRSNMSLIRLMGLENDTPEEVMVF